MSYAEEQEKVRQLALLCLESRELTDEELDQIINSSSEIWRYLSNCQGFAAFGAEQTKRSRLRRKELDKLTTEELEHRGNEINARRVAIRADDWNDDLPDSFFKAPPIGSDQRIINDLLETRREKVEK